MALKKYTNETQFTLRINTEVLERIKEFALQDGRSTAKEIEAILRQYIISQADKKKEI